MCVSCERWLRGLPARLERMANDPEKSAAAMKALAKEPCVLDMARERAEQGEG